MPHLLTAAQTAELIADHKRNMSSLRATGAFARYGSALRGTGDVQRDEADAFRAAPVWGAGL